VTVTDYTTAQAFLHTRDHPVPRKKVANNTYVERRSAIAIAVRFHDTDVVTYYSNGAMSLATGGWYSMSTKDRIDRFTPTGVRIFSEMGRWMITVAAITTTDEYGTRDLPDWTSSVPFFDGMTLSPDERVGTYSTIKIDTTAEDRHNAMVRKLMRSWSKKLATDKLIEQECAQCQGAEENGVSIGDQLHVTKHLLDHLVDGTWSEGLRICVARRVAPRNWEWRVQQRYNAPRDYSRYFTERLYIGVVASKHGTYPQDNVRATDGRGW
jgi:hypothetical protein